MASLNSYLPPEGSAVWRRDRNTESEVDSQTVCHVVIRSTEVISEPSAHVIYRIDVLTEHSHWYICRRYSEFHDLHRKLVRRCKINKDLLPPKKLSGNFSHQLIKQRKQQLEQYLQKLINSETHVSQAPELLSFLDVPAHDVIRVAELLARQLYSIGDKLLEEGTPIALTINDLYCITKRLQLPVDPQKSADPFADLGHLYGFLHQIISLKVILPPPPYSVTRMAFEISHFKSLKILKIEDVPLTQVSGMARVQQQLKKLSMHHTLKSLRELLVDSVEERRMGLDSKQFTDSWRLMATAKFTSNRVVVQPWHNLTTLNISHNKITCLDDSLQVLPVLKELNASHNLIVHLDLQHLCLPFLTHVNLSSNHITTVNSRSLVIESVNYLNLAGNGIFDLSFLCAFVGVQTINLCNNRVSSKRELDFISNLRTLQTVHLKGNPIMVTGAARIVLMAKFVLKSKSVAIDGAEATNGEQNRIHQQMKRHGTDVDNWPVSRSLKPQNSPSKLKLAEENPSLAPPPSPPSVHVSWTIESLKKPFRSNDSPTQSNTEDSNSSVYSDGSFDNPLFSDSPIAGASRTHSKNSSLLLSRDEPDGRSDISVDPPSDPTTMVTSSPLVLPTPPCTPLSTGGDDSQVTYSGVTPQMISAALEALTVSVSSTPSESGQLPGILTQALNDFISGNSSKCGTPPSTPQDQDEYTSHVPISASDLISAITSTLSAHCESTDNLSTLSSGAPSVPFGTPRDTSGLSELSLLGIQPESLLSALNKIRGNKDDDQVELQSDNDDSGSKDDEDSITNMISNGEEEEMNEDFTNTLTRDDVAELTSRGSDGSGEHITHNTAELMSGGNDGSGEHITQVNTIIHHGDIIDMPATMSNGSDNGDDSDAGGNGDGGDNGDDSDGGGNDDGGDGDNGDDGDSDGGGNGDGDNGDGGGNGDGGDSDCDKQVFSHHEQVLPPSVNNESTEPLSTVEDDAHQLPSTQIDNRETTSQCLEEVNDGRFRSEQVESDDKNGSGVREPVLEQVLDQVLDLKSTKSIKQAQISINDDITADGQDQHHKYGSHEEDEKQEGEQPVEINGSSGDGDDPEMDSPRVSPKKYRIIDITLDS